MDRLKVYFNNIENTSTNSVLGGRWRPPHPLCSAVFAPSPPLQPKSSANGTSPLLFSGRTAAARGRCTITKKQTIDFLIISFI
jgi:hypothetical protein